jgi:hypothetical protein
VRPGFARGRSAGRCAADGNVARAVELPPFRLLLARVLALGEEVGEPMMAAGLVHVVLGVEDAHVAQAAIAETEVELDARALCAGLHAMEAGIGAAISVQVHSAVIEAGVLAVWSARIVEQAARVAIARG